MTDAPFYESVIKVNVRDQEADRAADISEGLLYACALLRDEYGWPLESIFRRFEEIEGSLRDEEAGRD